MSTPALVIVEVSGGAVQAVYCDCNVKVIVADRDNHEAGDPLCHVAAMAPLMSADIDIKTSDEVREALS